MPEPRNREGRTKPSAMFPSVPDGGIAARDVPNVFYRTYRRTSEALHLLDTAPPGYSVATTDCVHQLAPASSLVVLQRLSGDRWGDHSASPRLRRPRATRKLRGSE